MKKNVVLIRTTSIYNDSRAVKEAKALKEAGYNVIVIGWDRDGYAKTKTEKDNDFCDEIIFYNEPAVYGSGVKNIAKLLKFLKWLYFTLKKIKQIDVIHACDFDTACVAYRYAKNKGMKLVYDIFDYYIDCHNMPNLLKKIIENMDIKIIDNADLVIICTDERKKQIKKASPKKCITIHNSPEIPDNFSSDRICKSNTNKVKICYVGILQDDRLLKEIGEEIINHDDIELHIGGFGKYEEYFKELSKNSNNVYFYGRMDYKDVLELESECDVLFATYNPQVPNHKYSAPNKVYEAMALGKTIVVCENTGIDDIVINNKIGASIKYETKEFFEKVNGLRNVKGQKIDTYSWKEMKKKLVKAYKEILK